MEQLTKNPRIEVVDALRGFAVMAIILVHNLEHFIFPVYPTDSPAWLSVLDQGVFNGTFTLFAGKAYAIFALLFGFTFYIQTNNQKRQGKDFGYRFLWRLVLLVGFATLNAAFFPAGDVLLLFVVVGLVLFFTRNWSDKAIFITAVIFLLQPVEWYHYIASLVNPAHRLPDLKVGEMYAEVAEYTKAGNFWDFILGNITLGQKASLQNDEKFSNVDRKPVCCGPSMPDVFSRRQGCSYWASISAGSNFLFLLKKISASG